MDVTERLLVDKVSYGRGVIDIQVIPQVVNAEGKVIAARRFEHISIVEPDAVAIGAEQQGRTDGEWGNAEIEKVILAERVIDQPAVPERAALPPAYDDVGNKTRDYVPAVPGTPATYKPRFSTTTIVWD